MPLYTDSMPALVAEFIEALEPLVGREGNPRVGFLVQSGFSEALHSRGLERYLAKLAARLGSPYAGTIVKGGGESLQAMPDEALRGLFARLQSLGEQLARDGRFDAETLHAGRGHRAVLGGDGGGAVARVQAAGDAVLLERATEEERRMGPALRCAVREGVRAMSDLHVVFGTGPAGTRTAAALVGGGLPGPGRQPHGQARRVHARRRGGGRGRRRVRRSAVRRRPPRAPASSTSASTRRTTSGRSSSRACSAEWSRQLARPERDTCRSRTSTRSAA